MKKEIHPQYYSKATVQCACGNIIVVGSTKELIETEVCYKCHPFYTGKEKVIDTLGMVDKYKKRLAKKNEKTKK
jgi:large subunit ribosomal protein L31